MAAERTQTRFKTHRVFPLARWPADRSAGVTRVRSFPPPCAKREAVTLVRQWFMGDEDYVDYRDTSSRFRRPQRHQNIIVATPEKLRYVDGSHIDEIAGVIVIDLNCIMYRARGGRRNGRFYRNDRPQRVAHF